MASELRPFSENILWTTMFAFMILSFAYFFISASNPVSSVTNDTRVIGSMANLSESMNSWRAFGDTTKSTLDSSLPSPIKFVFLIFEGAYYIPKNFIGTVGNGIVTLFNSLYSFGNMIAIVAIVLTIIGSVLMIRLVLYIIKAIRTGESER